MSFVCRRKCLKKTSFVFFPKVAPLKMWKIFWGFLIFILFDRKTRPSYSPINHSLMKEVNNCIFKNQCEAALTHLLCYHLPKGHFIFGGIDCNFCLWFWSCSGRYCGSGLLSSGCWCSVSGSPPKGKLSSPRRWQSSGNSNAGLRC